MNQKVLIIGWDGATFDVLMPLIELGIMPNLQALLKQGASGVLQSTIPPVTAPAWTSFATGVNPGKHGVITWQRLIDNNTPAKRVIDSQDVKAPRFWEWLEAHTIGLVNLPITYPPIPMNGFTVAGMLTPNLESQYTFPSHLRESLDQITGGYVIDVDIEGASTNSHDEESSLTLIRSIQVACRRRTKAAVHLAKKFQPDLYIVVFVVPDRIQHILWPYATNAEFSGKNAIVQNAVTETYQQLDASLGILLTEIVDQHTTVILLSDHGFCNLHSVVYMNGWLSEQGLLSYRRSMAIRGVARNLYRSLRRSLSGHLVRRGRAFFSADAMIDWKHTHAFAAGTMDHGVNVNLRGREPFGIVEEEEYQSLRQELRQQIETLRDPRTGTLIAKQVLFREEAYQGPYVDLAPDIVYELNPGYKVVPTPASGFRIEDVSNVGWGFHDSNGILVMNGPDIVPGTQLGKARIEDIAPTVLYLMSKPVPKSMDGRVLGEAFFPNHLQEAPLTFTDWKPPPQAKASTIYEKPEQLAIEARLRDLGYL
jgi:predicted AlkP superfamily phosphohydrolase/phosphomutase